MVVAEGPNEYILYAQNDHGDLAGQFAAHWGNENFSPLNPRDSMVLVAEAHDNGWWHWDINPAMDDQGVPITFRKTPRERLYEFINIGINNVLGQGYLCRLNREHSPYRSAPAPLWYYDRGAA